MEVVIVPNLNLRPAWPVKTTGYGTGEGPWGVLENQDRPDFRFVGKAVLKSFWTIMEFWGTEMNSDRPFSFLARDLFPLLFAAVNGLLLYSTVSADMNWSSLEDLSESGMDSENAHVAV